MLKNEDGRPQSCYSGSATTAGNLVFVGKNDGRLVALNATDGRELWDFQTGAGANAPATVFEVDGRQKVAIVAGGNALAGTTHGANLWVFSLDGRVEPLASLQRAGEAIEHANEETGAEPGEGEGDREVSDRPDPAAGRQVFADNCATCHGVAGRGGNGGPDLTSIPDTRNFDAVKQQTEDGGSSMPAFRDSLTPKQIDDVAAFVNDGIN
jgi:cytochrome c553